MSDKKKVVKKKESSKKKKNHSFIEFISSYRFLYSSLESYLLLL